jgi:hypothetical protein
MAFATLGNNDTANLYGSGLGDTFIDGGSHATMSGSGYSNYVEGFGTVNHSLDPI